ncbi:MAG: PAS domain-containing sensor histidine kinase [Aquamicrobium sp.]|uniref:sensor histidine kinase n=1 Tax=Aquamicrobium sp. TaxID=1872579 RepID=UPI00349EC984|nr:PAS domain-containing sensor histidine kinase [Aquamicrobium sp.]
MNGWAAGVAAGFERLVHPGVTGEDRARQRRLLGVLLAGPFVVSAAVAQAAWPFWGVSGVLAMLCALFGASWLIALSVVARGRARVAQWVALGGATVLAGSVAAMSGGMASPVAMLIAAIPLETWWVSRSRRETVVASLMAVAAVVAVASVSAPAGAAVSAWLWIAPALYGATLALRGGLSDAAVAAPEAAERTIPESGLDAVVVRLSRNGEVENASAQAARIFGVEPELLLGNGLFERIHVADRVAFLCAASQARDEGRPARCEARIRLPAGEGGSVHHPFEIEMAPVGVGAVAAILRDGREKAELRERVARAGEKIDSAEISKGRFLATVSHELRTPLNAIIGFSDMLLHREISGELTTKQSEHVGLIRDAGNHLLSVVNAILDVSKIEAGSYPITVEPFDLKNAVELCRAMLEPQAQERGVTLAANLPHGLGQVLGDRRAVQQILLNLLSNAVKFTPKGGQVNVNASCRAGMVRIFVNDTGIGIAGDDLARLGTPFTQVQNDYTRQFQGTGLGLSLVKGLVKLHGGTMSIESAPGLGTTVTVGLPAADPQGDGTAQDDEADETGEERYGTALRKIA